MFSFQNVVNIIYPWILFQLLFQFPTKRFCLALTRFHQNPPGFDFAKSVDRWHHLKTTFHISSESFGGSHHLKTSFHVRHSEQMINWSPCLQPLIFPLPAKSPWWSVVALCRSAVASSCKFTDSTPHGTNIIIFRKILSFRLAGAWDAPHCSLISNLF